MWKAHGIEPGIYTLPLNPVRKCALLIEIFQFQINDISEVKKNTQLEDQEETETEQLLFHCLEPECTFSFMSFNEYDRHMVVWDHTNTCQETESVSNKVKRD